MRLWKTTYTLDCELWTDTCVDFWHSTGKVPQSTQQRFWDKVHPDFYTVTDYDCHEVYQEQGMDLGGQLIERVYKE